MQDGNFGMIRQVLSRHRELSVIRIGRVYAAVPLTLIATKLNTSEAETLAYVQSLIDQNLLNARIERSQGMSGGVVLKFLRDSSHGPPAKSEDYLRAELARQTERTNSLAQAVAEADGRLSLSKDYLANVSRIRKSAEQHRGSPEREGTDMSFAPAGASDDDESVMET